MNDDDLRNALHDAASQVHPHRDFTEIRTRAHQEAPMSRRWYAPALAAAAAVVIAIGGVAWFTEHQRSTTPVASDGGHDDPAQPQASTSPEPVDPGHTSTLRTYFVGRTAAGFGLYAERHTLDEIRTTDLDAAIADVVQRGPRDPDYVAWEPADGLVAHAEEENGTVTVDFSGEPRRPSDMTDDEAQMMVQSLVWTVADVVGTEVPVTFTIDGRSVNSILDVPAGPSVGMTSQDSTLAPVQITSPAQGDTVSTRFQVEGMASAFEANVVWELKQGDQVVRTGFATAAECCTLSPYSFEVTAPPGRYTLVVHDTDESDGEGNGTNEDTKEITVR